MEIKILKIPDEVSKVEGRWERLCPNCGVTISHLRRNYCVHSHNNKQPCKKCSNTSNHPVGLHRSVRISWFNSFYKSSIGRGYEWNLTLDDVADCYEMQNGTCALSGLEIGWSETNWEHTASIDRINNSVGYNKNNIHLVHKRINMMRGSMSIEDFVYFCGHVANKVKW